MDIIDLLSKYIESQGLSQADFARKISYNPVTLNRIINRKRLMTKPLKRKFMLSEGFHIEDLAAKETKEIITEAEDSMKSKIIARLNMITENNSGKVRLEYILRCVENELSDYIRYKQAKLPKYLKPGDRT